jgi:hypothetical protein
MKDLYGKGVATHAGPESRAVWSSQDSVETWSPRRMSPFELLGTEPVEMGVATRLIVEGINAISHIGDRRRSVLVSKFLDSLFPQASEERLGDGISQQLPFRLTLGSRDSRRRIAAMSCCRTGFPDRNNQRAGAVVAVGPPSAPP